MCALPIGLHASVSEKQWGKDATGHDVKLYTLDNGDLKMTVTNFGARVVRLDVPDIRGQRADVVLGYDNAEQYLSDSNYFGAVVGRYGNRIKDGKFSLNGKFYQVPVNNMGNALHGGRKGFSSLLWTGRIEGSNAVEFKLTSADGDMGFPGTLEATVVYRLQANQVLIEYRATSNQDTVVNLTSHSYFNLAGEARGDILDEQVTIHARRYTPVDRALIPTGELADVTGTPFDFRIFHAIGQRIAADDEQLRRGRGYDHNFVLDETSGSMREAMVIRDPLSGRVLTISTTEPGLQFYSGNFLDGSVKGYTHRPYEVHGAFTAETQHFPNSPNEPAFPTTRLNRGQIYSSKTCWTFTAAAPEH